MQHHNLILKNVSYGFLGGPLLIQELTLHIQASSYVILVGPNGSGKSTLFSLLRGQLHPSTGSIHVGGKNVSDLRLKERGRLIASVTQNPLKGTFAHMSLYENLAFAERRGRMFSLKPLRLKTRKAAFQEHLRLLGMGLEDRLEDLAGSLSGGQQQALSLAMATFCDAQVLLLDEPTAALDPAMAERIMEMTQTLRQRKELTMLMVTHNLDHALRFGDRLLFWQGGQVRHDFDGSAKQALTRRDLETFFKI